VRSLFSVETLLAWLLTSLLAVVALAPDVARADVRPEQITTTRSKTSPLTYHYPKRYRPGIDRLGARAEQVTGDLARTLGFDSFPKVDVWVLPEVDDYFEYHDRDDRAPKWAIGLSFSNEQTVIVARNPSMPGSTAGDFEKTFIHELAHVGMDIAREGAHVPRWFNEGFALMHAREWTKERSDKLARAASTESLIPLADLDRDFPAHHNVASLAYAQSFHIVRYMRSNYGDDVFARILEELRAERSFPEAVESATGRSLAALEGGWRETISGETSWLAILRDEFAWFFGAAVIFIIAWVARRLRTRRDPEAMADDDVPEEWAYDDSRYPLPGDTSDDSTT
jgi:hypothetical protein